ncbi:DUF4014 family protein [Salmonella enterica subsp. enterica]|nr:DUF4014 family protein [Salmonella enterica subsp. enterica]
MLPTFRFWLEAASCTACNGGEVIDHNQSKCSSCNGTGKEAVQTKLVEIRQKLNAAGIGRGWRQRIPEELSRQSRFKEPIFASLSYLMVPISPIFFIG